MEEKEIKIIEDLLNEYEHLDYRFGNMLDCNQTNTIQKLLQAYKKDEKVIEEMAEYIAEITDCPAENCNTLLDCENRCSNDDKVIQECWKMYFRKKCE